jgi:hypothetical protein
MHSAAPIHLAVSFAAMAATGAGIACIGNDRFVLRRKEGRGVSYANDVAGSSVAPPGKSRCCKREKLERILIVACPAKNVSQPCDTVNRRRLALRQDCDLMHTVSDSPRIQDNAMDLCTGISGAPLLASLRYAGCCRSTGPCKVILLMGCTVTTTVTRGR